MNAVGMSMRVAMVQVHIRRGRPHERFLSQIAEVVVTAAAISLCAYVNGHFRQKLFRRAYEQPS